MDVRRPMYTMYTRRCTYGLLYDWGIGDRWSLIQQGVIWDSVIHAIGGYGTSVLRHNS